MNKSMTFRFRGREWRCDGTTRVMGIVNVTPDSFSDGGECAETEAAVTRALAMLDAGAVAVDIGGESTRPGAAPVSEAEELDRVVPTIRRIRELRGDAVISVDTTKRAVAAAAVAAGADILNDISGLQADPGLAEVAAATGAGLVLMHMRGTPQTMQQDLHYDDLLGEICTFLENAMAQAEAAGVAHESILLDPGIGFSKDAAQNLAILAKVATFHRLGRPLLVGPSRKSFLAPLLAGAPPAGRVWGTAGAVAWLAMQGVDVVRVHDVREMTDLLQVLTRLRLEADEGNGTA
jgi:dihydropteroate synthase